VTGRQAIAEVVNEGLSKTRVRKLLDDAFASEVTVAAECPHCGSSGLKVKVPDVKRQLDVVAGLLEQAEGRPEQRAPGELVVIVERPAL
jgi:transposase